MDWVRVRWAEMRAGALLPQAGWAWWMAGAVAVLLLVGAGVFAVAARRLGPSVQRHIVAALEQQLGSPVRVGAVTTRFDGGLRVDVDGVEAQSVVRGLPGTAADPMLRVAHVRVHLPLGNALRVWMAADSPSRMAAALHLSHATLEDAHVRFATGDPARAPLQFDLPRVEMAGLDRLFAARRAGQGERPTFDYDALVNTGDAVGVMRTQGTMGPWNAADPRGTPLAGTVEFDRHPVRNVPGLRGMLSLRARYSGTLSLLEIEGETDDPEFALDVSAHPMHLHTTFRMTTDTAHGVVQLRTMDARYLQTHFVLSGMVTKSPATAGYVLDMALTVPEGRVEDALALAAPTEPPLLRGMLRLQGRLQLPAGTGAVSKRLRLRDGRFTLERAQFGRPSVQAEADSLSEKASGRPEEAHAGEAAASAAGVTGAVALEAGMLQFREVRLVAPGVSLALAGSYALGGRGFNMRGVLHTEATASDMQTGVMKMLTRPFNGLFKHGRQGTTLPLEVTGTGNTPHFELLLPGGKKMEALR